MEFLQSQETLTTIEWTLRAIIAFLFLLTVAKALGQRAISQLRLLDFVIALVIGNIIAHPLSDPELGLKGSIVTTIVLVILYIGGVLGILKWPWLRRLMNNDPVVLVENGEIRYKGLKKAKISLDVLLEELREAKVHDVKNVAIAMWEADGKISVFQHPQYEPVTPSTLHMPPQPFDLPRTVIKEGQIIQKELDHMQKDEKWIVYQLNTYHQASVDQILLGTLDKKGTLRVFFYC